MQPLLAASSLRVDVGAAPLIDGLSFESTGEWVLLLGAPQALFEAAAGLRPVRRGTLNVAGAPALDAARSGTSTSVPLDPPLPPQWTAAEYVGWSTRIAGYGRTEARRLAREALVDVGIDGDAATRLGRGSLVLRRSVVLAAALATSAEVLLVEDPLSGVPEGEARAFARRITRALSRRLVVYFAARVPLDSPVALAADEAIVLGESSISAQGPPAEIAAEERTFGVRVAGDASAFALALNAEGGRLVFAPFGSNPVELTVQLGSLSTLDLFRIAEATHALVLELRPIASALT